MSGFVKDPALAVLARLLAGEDVKIGRHTVRLGKDDDGLARVARLNQPHGMPKPAWFGHGLTLEEFIQYAREEYPLEDEDDPERPQDDPELQHEAVPSVHVQIKTGHDPSATCRHCGALFNEGVKGVCPARFLEQIVEGFQEVDDKHGGILSQPSKTPTQEVAKHDLLPPRPGFTELLGLLREFADDEPCDLDHDGGCQAHNSFGDGECRNAHARRLLDVAEYKVEEGLKKLARSAVAERDALKEVLRENMEYCRDHCRGTGVKRGGNGSGPCTWKPCIQARALVGERDE